MGRNGAADPAAPEERRRRLLERMMRPETRARVCAQVADAKPHAPYALVEEAFQEACLLAASKCHGRSEAETFNWLRTTTLHELCHALRRAQHRHEQLVDWSNGDWAERPAARPADDEAIERERERELAELVRTVCAGLSERQCQVAALHSHGLAGREIAAYMRTSERRVKHLKHEALTRARDALAGAAGGGCEEGERLIGRLAFGLASARERSEAQLHLPACERCGALYQRLELWHEKVAALLPIPAAAQVDPGLLERGLHKTADALAHAKQQFADAASHAKQHATAGYTRAVEYTPLASVRPGAAATAIAGCLALGGGAAGYCIDRGVDPITGLIDVIQPAPAEPAPPQRNKPPATEQPPDPPQLLATPPPASAPAPPGPDALAPAPQPAPAPAEPPPPPPEQEQFDPAAAAAAEPAPQQSSPSPRQPAPAPDSGVGEFLGGP